jgi:hypothetical protein
MNKIDSWFTTGRSRKAPDGRMLLNQHSLLGHVALGLTLQVENLATESLLYLLRRYRTAHEAFVDLVSTIGYVPPSDLEFSTQVHMQHGSIPDLVGATADERGVLLVESKFWAPLTPNQLTGYLRRLSRPSLGPPARRTRRRPQSAQGTPHLVPPPTLEGGGY